MLGHEQFGGRHLGGGVPRVGLGEGVGERRRQRQGRRVGATAHGVGQRHVLRSVVAEHDFGFPGQVLRRGRDGSLLRSLKGKAFEFGRASGGVVTALTRPRGAVRPRRRAEAVAAALAAPVVTETVVTRAVFAGALRAGNPLFGAALGTVFTVGGGAAFGIVTRAVLTTLSLFTLALFALTRFALTRSTLVLTPRFRRVAQQRQHLLGVFEAGREQQAVGHMPRRRKDAAELGGGIRRRVGRQQQRGGTGLPHRGAEAVGELRRRAGKAGETQRQGRHVAQGEGHREVAGGRRGGSGRRARAEEGREGRVGVSGQGHGVAVDHVVGTLPGPAAARREGGVHDDAHASAAGTLDGGAVRFQQPHGPRSGKVAVQVGYGQSRLGECGAAHVQSPVDPQRAGPEQRGELPGQRRFAREQQAPVGVFQGGQRRRQAPVRVAALRVKLNQAGVGPQRWQVGHGAYCAAAGPVWALTKAKELVGEGRKPLAAYRRNVRHEKASAVCPAAFVPLRRCGGRRATPRQDAAIDGPGGHCRLLPDHHQSPRATR